MRRLVLGTSIGVIGGTLILAGAALAAAVGNGSFESGPSTPSGGFTTLTAPDTSIPDWTVTSGTIDYINGHWTAAEGTKSIDLNGLTPGSISQTLSTVVGATYTVSFALAGNPEGGPALKTMTVTANGGSPAAYSFDTTGKTNTNMGWTAQTYSFVATTTSTSLTFASTTGGVFPAFGPALDNVSVTDNIVTSKDQCKNGGWENLADSSGNAFKNQGDCVSFVATKGKNLAAG